ncbi:MAG: serine/threonine-protein kinase RsbW [Solirubrobacteraceae bacterium]|nr:serine/threonine-protein kinase RsbW [Solirubrobacteraceae bacterium]
MALGRAPYLSWPATPQAIGDARSEIVGRARAAGASADVLTDIKLAVSEACANAVMHAYVTRHRRAERFAVATATDGERFDVWITDEGRCAAPDVASGGAGLGLGLMTALSVAMVIGCVPDGGTQVHLTFALRRQASGMRAARSGVRRP